MAVLTKTISNRMSVSGPSPANKWGGFNWGENWGESGDGYFTVRKYIAETLAFSSSQGFSATKLLSLGVTVASRINFGGLFDGSGYSYVFASSVTDPDSRFFPTWTEASEPSSSFTETSEPTTTWTDA